MRYSSLVAAVSFAACTSETSGERVQLHWVVEQATDPSDFTTSTGFQVHLDEARVELASVYLYAPPSARLSALAWLERSVVSVAHAHGGLDNEKGRRVLAELTKPLSIDALADAAVDLEETSGEGGAVDAVKLAFVDGAVAHVRGRANRDGYFWGFEADIDPDESVLRTVELIELDDTLAQGSVVQISTQPKTWVDLCDFSRLGAGVEDPEAVETFEIAADNQVGRALSIGVRSPDAFKVEVGEEGNHAH
jgi:hypothetical protein